MVDPFRLSLSVTVYLSYKILKINVLALPALHVQLRGVGVDVFPSFLVIVLFGVVGIGLFLHNKKYSVVAFVVEGLRSWIFCVCFVFVLLLDFICFWFGCSCCCRCLVPWFVVAIAWCSGDLGTVSK